MGDDDDSPGASPPAATGATDTAPLTRQEWGARLLNGFLRRLDQNLRVLNTLRNPRAQLFLFTGTEETVEVVDSAMSSLEQCSSRLERVGPPPARPPLERIYDNLQRACTQYEEVADVLLRMLPLVQTGEQADVNEARRIFPEIREPSRLGAEYYTRALRIIEAQGLLTPAA